MPEAKTSFPPPARLAPADRSAFGCSAIDGPDGSVWVTVTGELDLATTPQLVQALHRSRLRSDLVVLDLRGLAFIDSAGVRVIARASDSAGKAGARLMVIRGLPVVDRVFALTGLGSAIELTGPEGAGSRRTVR